MPPAQLPKDPDSVLSRVTNSSSQRVSLLQGSTARVDPGDTIFDSTQPLL
jgi:hypothetical protein